MVQRMIYYTKVLNEYASHSRMSVASKLPLLSARGFNPLLNFAGWYGYKGINPNADYDVRTQAPHDYSKVCYALMAVLFLIVALTTTSQAQTLVSLSNSPSLNYDATVATEWFNLALELTQETKGYSPPVSSRTFAYMGVTLYEAVAPFSGNYKTLAGQLNGLTELPQPEENQKYHAIVVANRALAEITRKLFSDASEENLAKIDKLEKRFRVGNEDVVSRSEAFGHFVAEAIYAWSLEDGSQTKVDYVLSDEAGSWQPTTPKFANALLPQWGQNRRFVSSENDCEITAPIAYSTEKASVFYRQGLEVYQTSQSLTREQSDIALFWSDEPGKTATPPGHWLAITTQVLESKNTNLFFAAETYAKVSLAVADSFIAVWKAKYQYNILRPITYLRQEFNSEWQPLLNTPAFPEYPSGHSVQSAAAAFVLTTLFGDNFSFTDHTHNGHGLQARSFASFNKAAEEAALSRLYGGIHFRAAVENGLVQGRCIGESVLGLEFRDQGTK
jgi:PAP2 superfamily